MWEFILAAGNVPFVAALVLMLLIGVVEALGLGAGLAVGEGIDGLDGDVNVETPSLLSWINVGRLPLLMLIVVFLFAFGMTGLIGQRLFAAFLGQPAPWFMAAPAALIIALPVTQPRCRCGRSPPGSCSPTRPQSTRHPVPQEPG